MEKLLDFNFSTNGKLLSILMNSFSVISKLTKDAYCEIVDNFSKMISCSLGSEKVLPLKLIEIGTT